MSYSYIRASEIAEYVYCRRSWWLQRRQSVASLNVRQMEAGTHHHEEHSRLLYRSELARRVAYVAIFAAVSMLVYQIFTG